MLQNETTDVSAEKIQEMSTNIYNKLDSTGAEISRNDILRQLSVDINNVPQVFSSALEELIRQGKVARRKGGPGGVIWRIDVDQGHGDVDDDDSSTKKAERDLYVPIMTVLRDHWISKYHYAEDTVIENIAEAGRKNTGGRWSRPDLVLVGKRKYEFLPNTYFDIVTFEVKANNKYDISSVYEAMSHRRRATHSYLVLELDGTKNDNGELIEKSSSRYQSVLREADEQGIGLVTFTDASDWNTWDFELEPTRVDGDPVMLDEFLSNQLSENGKKCVKNIIQTKFYTTIMID